MVVTLLSNMCIDWLVEWAASFAALAASKTISVRPSMFCSSPVLSTTTGSCSSWPSGASSNSTTSSSSATFFTLACSLGCLGFSSPDDSAPNSTFDSASSLGSNWSSTVDISSTKPCSMSTSSGSTLARAAAASSSACCTDTISISKAASGPLFSWSVSVFWSLMGFTSQSIQNLHNKCRLRFVVAILQHFTLISYIVSFWTNLRHFFS